MRWEAPLLLQVVARVGRSRDMSVGSPLEEEEKLITYILLGLGPQWVETLDTATVLTIVMISYVV